MSVCILGTDDIVISVLTYYYCCSRVTSCLYRVVSAVVIGLLLRETAHTNRENSTHTYQVQDYIQQ